MNLIRTFHPIGQGAFYTERHVINNKEFTIVYDCGSTTLKRETLEKKIKSTFPKDHPIDILFISHFHADHINGIETLHKHCSIKKVVVPFIDDDARTLLKITNLIENNYSDTRLIDNPNDFFDEIPIISIIPNDIPLNDTGIGTDNQIIITTINESEKRPSGTVFVPAKSIDWFFIPFNYNHKKRKKQFEVELEKSGLKLSDLDTISKINKHKDKIITAYKTIDGDLNENSLVLFSGKCNNDQLYFAGPFMPFSIHYLVKHGFQSGCLYMGDIDLKELDISSNLKAKLKLFFPYIGTLQVPHHGSIHNFDSSILDKQILCSVFSYGTTNNYGHPSDRVIGDVIANGSDPHFVTEDQYSILIQCK